MKAFACVCVGIAGTLVTLTAIGYILGRHDRKKAEAAPEAAAPTTQEPAPASPQGDTVAPFDDVVQAQADEARFHGTVTPPASEVPSTTPHKEQRVKMKIAQGNDPIEGSVEQQYMALIKAIHEKKIQGTVWRGEGDLPDADVIELRGRTIDMMTALRTPRIYFETSRPGMTLAYQYTTRKNPLLFLQLDGCIYVLGSDEQRFMSSVPNPDELQCDPSGYLNVVLSVMLEKLGLDENPLQA